MADDDRRQGVNLRSDGRDLPGPVGRAREGGFGEVRARDLVAALTDRPGHGSPGDRPDQRAVHEHQRTHRRITSGRAIGPSPRSCYIRVPRTAEIGPGVARRPLTAFGTGP